ncbi:MAG: DedA family protein [Candidatus Poseidoniales archaeon]|nr:MAG: DedA family protein [Candidatus Poseidoniales archaeon]
MLSQIIDTTIDWADSWGLIGLAVVSATEAMFQPAPPDLLVIPMVLNSNGSVTEIFAIVLTATIFSVFGSLGGYAIGMYAGRPFLEKFAKPNTISRIDNLFLKYGSMGVFIAAISPIPYKAFAWAAGSGKMNIRLFVFAGLLGRGIRFGLEGIVLGFYGEEFSDLMYNPFFWLFGGVLATALFFPLNTWWNSLIIPDNNSSE